MSPYPSPSESAHCVESSGNLSPSIPNWLSPQLSPSESVCCVGLFGKASVLSPTLSPSESMVSLPSFGKASELSPTPSESESSHSDISSGNSSTPSTTPSLSRSVSRRCTSELELDEVRTNTPSPEAARKPTTSPCIVNSCSLTRVTRSIENTLPFDIPIINRSPNSCNERPWPTEQRFMDCSLAQLEVLCISNRQLSVRLNSNDSSLLVNNFNRG